MIKHRIALDILTPHGQADAKMEDGSLTAWTTHSITPIGITDFSGKLKKHYISLPGKYRLPLRVDLTVKLDNPSFYLFIGEGHITFASSGQDNRKLEDVIKHSSKPNQDHYAYNNSLPLGEYTEISVIYNRNEMQICIGGEERFYSRKQAYMRAKNFDEVNNKGISIGFAVSKRSMLRIQEITVTEADNPLPVSRSADGEEKLSFGAKKDPKPTFETVLSGLPRGFQDRLVEMDAFLRFLKPLKCKRVLDKSGNKITYVAADYGVSYAVEVWDGRFTHCFNWYIVYNGKPETWHRKADYMEEALMESAKSNPGLSERLFYALNDCVGCHGPGCLARTSYVYNGQKKMTCHGRVMLRMCEGDLRDAKEFFENLNRLVERKIANGEPKPEKILLRKA